MGRASRWFRGIFRIKKTTEEEEEEETESFGFSCFGHSARDSTGLCHNPATIPPNITPAEASWLRSFYNVSNDEQSKHAIIVAAASAAAADAAVAAAKAAVVVVKLTSHGRDTTFGRGGEILAALKIQSIFRGYLSRKALRALKGLVKLQALVRGYLVRKQAIATLHSIQALIRAQTAACLHKARLRNGDHSFHQHLRHRNSFEKTDETRIEKNIVAASIHSRRLSSSSSFEALVPNPLDEISKVVEIDTGTDRPKSRSKRTSNWVTDGHHLSYHSTPVRPTGKNHQDSGREECRCFCTAKTTPRFSSSGGSCRPSSDVRVDNFFRQYGNLPNYMSNTKSFNAKLRSQSAPKQRPETGQKKKSSFSEMLESSTSGVTRSSRVDEVMSFKNVVMRNLNRSSDFY